MDEPTTGLHMSDIQPPARHHQPPGRRAATPSSSSNTTSTSSSNADWIIDLGPEGGTGGGTIVFEGTPEQLTRTDGSHTADAVRHDLTA